MAWFERSAEQLSQSSNNPVTWALAGGLIAGGGVLLASLAPAMLAVGVLALSGVVCVMAVAGGEPDRPSDAAEAIPEEVALSIDAPDCRMAGPDIAGDRFRVMVSSRADRGRMH